MRFVKGEQRGNERKLWRSKKEGTKKIGGGIWGNGKQEGQRRMTENGLVMSDGTMYILSFGRVVFSGAKAQQILPNSSDSILLGFKT